MVLKERNQGVWRLKLEVGEYFEQNKEDLWVQFAGVTVGENTELTNTQMALATEDPNGIEVPIAQDDGTILRRKVAPKALTDWSNKLDELCSRHVLDHNIEVEEKDGKVRKIDNKELWAWVKERPDLHQYLTNTWWSNLPLVKGTQTKQR